MFSCGSFSVRVSEVRSLEETRRVRVGKERKGERRGAVEGREGPRSGVRRYGETGSELLNFPFFFHSPIASLCFLQQSRQSSCESFKLRSLACVFPRLEFHLYFSRILEVRAGRARAGA